MSKFQIMREVLSYAERSLKLEGKILLSGTEREPSITFEESDKSYYDGDRNEIHVGTNNVIELLRCSDEQEMLSGLKYLRDHEIQHKLSTSFKPYGQAITAGAKVLAEFIVYKEFKARPRNERDLNHYLEKYAKSNNTVNPMNILLNFSAGIVNSLEDGRIERIRRNKYPGFFNQCKYFRAKFWNSQSIDFMPKYKFLSNTEKISIISANILTLSTCQLYAKGFILKYGDTPLLDTVIDLKPFIAQAVLARKTRGLISATEGIMRILAPMVYDMVKDMPSIMEFQNLLKEMLKQMLEDAESIKSFDTSENEEQEDMEESTNSLFGNSDLEITVDDETFDKLEEKQKEKGNKSNGNMIIKREHPKTEETESDTESKSNSGNESETDTEENSDGNSFRGDNASEEENTESGTGSTQSNDSSDSTDEKGNSSGTDSSEDTEPSTNTEKDRNGKRESGRAQRKSAEEAGEMDEEALLKEMAEAASTLREDAEENIERTNIRSSDPGPVIEDTEKPLSQESVKDICPDFRELKRQYKLTAKLPVELDRRGKNLLRKNQQYFKSLSTPTRRYLDSGSIDPDRIYGLSFGETDIFRKKGKNKLFDGCCYILIDNSGSMYGNKRREACKAAAVIEESYRGLIPIKITAFDWDNGIVHEVVKGWEEQQKYNCCWNYYLYGRDGYGNEDGYDIRVATRELLSRKESKKQLIILSDGAPGNRELVKTAVQEARRKGIVVNSIYFEEGNLSVGAEKTFSYMYEKDYICCPLNELDQNLSSIMRKFSRS